MEVEFNFVLNPYAPTYSTYVLMNLMLFILCIFLAFIYMYTPTYTNNKTKAVPIL